MHVTDIIITLIIIQLAKAELLNFSSIQFVLQTIYSYDRCLLLKDNNGILIYFSEADMKYTETPKGPN